MKANIKIPRGLALTIINSKTQRKALETYFLLKHHFPNGWLSASVKHLTSLEDDLGICYKTMAGRIKHLKNLKLISISNGTIKLSSYKAFCQKYGVSSSSYRIDPELARKVKLEHYLMALAIQEKKEECKMAFYAKHRKNNIQENIIKGVFNGVKPKGVSYTNSVLMAHLEQYILKGKESENMWAFEHARADIEVGYKRFTKLFGYSSRGSFAYIKRTLAATGIINVNERFIEFDRTMHSTRNSRKVSLGTVNYNTATKNLDLRLPDALILNSQKQIIEYAA